MVLELVLFGHPVVQLFIGRPVEDGATFVSNNDVDTELAEYDEEPVPFGFASPTGRP